MQNKSFRPRFSNNRGQQSGGRTFAPKRNRKRQYIDPSRFVQKAQEQAPIAPYAATHTFADFPIHPQLQQNIAQHGYVSPTPIQDQAIKPILEGNDLIGIANTGTGKTAAFLLPLIDKVIKNREEKVLIVVPTRELAVQIQEEFNHFAKNLILASVLCIGGADMQRQIRALRNNPPFVIGTPGRIKDLIQRRSLRLSFFKTIVLDEVDKMMDMGFIHDVKFLISELSPVRQSLFFSATVSRDMHELMQTFLRNPITVSVKTQETAANVDQDVVKINGRNKIDVLHDLIAQEDFQKVLLFGRTKHGVQKLARILEKRGFRVAAIHGNKSQNQRQRALQDFKSGRIQILLATDVAARGLDIDDVTHVINYDVPENYEDYVHRIGRTGRANKKGKALTFVD